MKENHLTGAPRPTKQRTLISSLLKVMFLVLIAITVFEYVKYVLFPGLTVFYSHIIGITFGVIIIGVTAYRVQKRQERLEIEKLAETERRMQVGASLRDAEEKYQKLLLGSMDGVCQTTLDGKIIEANQAFCDILGGDAEGIIGGSIARFYNNPEDRIKFRNMVEKNKGVKNYEIIQKRLDGEQIVCSVSSSYYYSQAGEVDGYLTIVRDITEQKRVEEALRDSEERYRHIVETSLEGIWITDAEHQVTFVNKRMANMLGYAPEEALGQRVASFIFEEGLEDHASRTAARERGEGEVFERRFRRKDGTPLWNIVSASPLFDGQNRFIGSFAMFTDITDRKFAEEALEEERRRLQRALDEIMTLRGIVPICSYCKKIRDDKGYWNQVEQYVSEHSEAKFSHAICPACLEKEINDLKA